MGDVQTIDTGYTGKDRYTAAYLLTEGDRAAFVETNTNFAVPRLLAALDGASLTPESVELIIITHIHLDHAGGAAKLMAACPNATLLAHPRAARHAIDPTKLVKSARTVYGDDVFDELYGDIQPIAAERVRALEDDETATFAGRTLRFLHTRGHANHHFCVLDAEEGTIYTGDAYGLVYPDLQGAGLFAFPSTSPTDFDAAAAHEAVDRIAESGATTAYPTHYGAVTDIAGVASQLHRWLDRSGDLVDELFASDHPDEALDDIARERVRGWFVDAVAERGLPDAPQTWALLEGDVELNAQGLAFAVKKKRFKAQRK